MSGITFTPTHAISLTKEQWAYIHDALVSFDMLTHAVERGIKPPPYLLQTEDEHRAGLTLIEEIEVRDLAAL